MTRYSSTIAPMKPRVVIPATLLVALAAVLVVVYVHRARPPAAVPVICQQFDVFNEQTGQLVPSPSLPQWLRQEAVADGCPVYQG